MSTDVNKIASETLHDYIEIIETCPKGKPWKVGDKLLSEALGVRVSGMVVDGELEIDEVMFTITYGGPNVYLKLKHNLVAVEVWWGSQYAHKSAWVDNNEVFEYIVDNLEEIING